MTRARSFSNAMVLAAGSMILGPIGASAQESPDYGTTNLTYVQVAAAAFVPMVSGTSYTTTTGPVLRVAGGAGGTQVYFAAPIDIPSGALLRSLELDACDNSGVPGYVQGTIVGSDRLGNIIHNVPYILTDGAGCETTVSDLTALNIVANNHTKHFWLVAIVGSSAANVGLAGMTVGYQLQVSPAPGAATFGDVPTGHPFFQFVEALAASGITGGCGGGNYCPDNPVTRGQMAVFLAKALGLQFQ
jgi:S-layer family protein